MKDVAKRAALGIGMAMCLFCIAGIIFDVCGGGDFVLANYQFTKMVIGCVIVGLGFGTPTIVYDVESMPMPLKVLIHMGIGCVVYTIVAFSVGWTGNLSLAQGIIAIVAQLVVAFVIWFIFMMHYKKEARKINERIQAMK